MAMRSVVFLLAVAVSAVLADPEFIFPEDASASAGRIVSGWPAEEGQFPYQLSLRMVDPAGGVTACGGTIISPEWGLTAAHCTIGRVTMVIRAGAVNLTRPGAFFETENYYIHPLFNQATSNTVQPNDVSLLGFGRVLTFTDNIQPIRLQRSAAMNANYAGQQAIASGWGTTWTGGNSTDHLNWVYLSLVSNEECLDAYDGSSIIAPSTICTRGYNDPTQSTCQGDSGGPLTTIDDDGQLSQVGIASFVSRDGCHAGEPAGFVRPGHYHDWYTEVTGVNLDWEYDIATTTGVSEETEESSESSESEESEETTEAASELTELSEQ